MICTAHQLLFGRSNEKNEMSGACSTYGGRSGVYRVLVGKPEGKRPLGKPRRSWEEVGRGGGGGGGMDWPDMAPVRDRWQALANVVINLQVP
jgi:hypothetical protein